MTDRSPSNRTTHLGDSCDCFEDGLKFYEPPSEDGVGGEPGRDSTSRRGHSGTVLVKGLPVADSGLPALYLYFPRGAPSETQLVISGSL